MPEEPPSRIQLLLPHLSRWRSLTQFLPTVLWFLAGIVFWVISPLFPLWWKCGGHRILMRASWQVDVSAQHWLLYFALNLVNWLISILAGALGGLVIKRHLVRNLCSLGIGFALVPLLLYAYDKFKVPELNYLSKRGSLVLLVVCCGMLTHYLKCRAIRKPSSEHSRIERLPER